MRSFRLAVLEELSHSSWASSVSKCSTTCVFTTCKLDNFLSLSPGSSSEIGLFAPSISDPSLSFPSPSVLESPRLSQGLYDY